MNYDPKNAYKWNIKYLVPIFEAYMLLYILIEELNTYSYNLKTVHICEKLNVSMFITPLLPQHVGPKIEMIQT